MTNVRKDYKKDPPVINITKTTIDILLKQPKCDSLISLYIFYVYTSVWQNTLQIKSTTAYTAKGMKWSVAKVQRTKKELVKLGLLEDIQKKEDDGRFGERYIKIYYVPYITKTVPHKTACTAKPRDKCLITNSDKCLDTGNYRHGSRRGVFSGDILLSPKDTSFSIRYGAKIQSILNIHSKYKPVTSKTWATQINYIIHRMNVDKEYFKEIMGWYLKEGRKLKYSPRLRKATDLVEKWQSIEDAFINFNSESGQPTVEYREGPDGVWGYYEVD